MGAQLDAGGVIGEQESPCTLSRILTISSERFTPRRMDKRARSSLNYLDFVPVLTLPTRCP